MKKVLILSDVHGNLPLAEEVIKNNKSDYILYLGDWGHKDRSILESNGVIAIQGNHPYENNEDIVKFIKIEDVDIMMTHGHYFSSLTEYVSNKKLLKGAEDGVSLILHGHTHIKKHDIEDDVIILNPGSLSEPRDSSRGSYITLNIDKDKVKNIRFHKV